MHQIENFLLLATIHTILFSVILLSIVMIAKFVFRARVDVLILSGMGMSILLWFAALAPIPAWSVARFELQDNSNTSLNAASPTTPSQLASSIPQAFAANSLAQEGSASNPETAPPGNPKSNLDQTATLPRQFQTFLQQLSVAPAAVSSEKITLSWKSWFAMIAVIGICIGIARLLVALISIEKMRRSGSIVSDPRVTEVLDIICAQLSYTRPVAVRQTEETSAAFTIGWRRPIVFIANDWEQWSDDQIKATLAHEVAHIAHGDFFQRMIAQAAVVLNFYNPVVHFLCSQLNLEQELSADDRAAEVIGGRKSYLNLLATMALETEYPKRRLSPMFLPTRKTFFRRIEMLRSNTLSRNGKSRMLGGLLAVVTLVAGLGLSGFRPTTNAAIAQEPNSNTIAPTMPETLAVIAASKMNEEANLRFVSRDENLVLVVRPSLILSDPIINSIVEELTDMAPKASTEFYLEGLGLKNEAIDQLTYILDIESSGTTVILQTIDNGWWGDTDPIRALANKFEKLESKTYRGETILQSQPAPSLGVFGDFHLYVPDAKTLIWSENVDSIKACIRTGEGPSGVTWQDDLLAHSKYPISVYTGPEAIDMFGTMATRNTMRNPWLGSLSPLWEDVNHVVGSVELHGVNEILIDAHCGGINSAEKVSETLNGLVPLTKNMLKSLQESPAGDDFPPGLLNIPMQLLESTKVETSSEHTVIVSSKLKGDATEILKRVIPAIVQSRKQANVAAAQNNLRQVALALHNYESAFRHFPPPVLTSPQGKKYSWRVAILPFIDQNNLYEAYRFDEEWNSEHNSKITAQIPPVFRHPTSDSNTNACYFAVVGENTMFPPTGKGMTFGNVIDGTSNTIMLVEAKTDIHWAEPKDIPYADTGLLKTLGGFSENTFSVAISDGSIQRVSRSISNDLLKNFLLRNDGHSVDHSQLNPNR